jgi:steroid delta-isomerase-like uncharacterized protein
LAAETASKELVRRLHTEVVEARNPERIDELFAEHFVSHNMPPGFPAGVDGVRRFFAMFAEALPDLTVTIDVMVAEEDLVAVRTTMRGTHLGRLMGMPPSHRRLAVDGVDILRIEAGRIVEHWGLTNTLGVLRQVGPATGVRWLVRLLARRGA